VEKNTTGILCIFERGNLFLNICCTLEK